MLKYINNEFQSDLFLLFETVGGMITIGNNNHCQIIQFSYKKGFLI